MAPTDSHIVRRCFLLVAIACLPGCGPVSPVSSQVEEYGKLPGLRATADRRLQEELARVEEIGGTPEALCGPEVPESENTAAVLQKLFPSRRLAGLKEYTDDLFPTNGFEFNPLHFEKALAFRDTQAEALAKCREALGRPQCDFGWNHERGFGNDVDFVDRVWVCARLEGFDAADHLHAEEDIDATLENVARMLRWAKLLAAEKAVCPRLGAAAIRDEIASVIIETAHSRKATPRHLAKAAELVYDTLQSWTPDSHAWIGDRAAVLHMYEAIRDGQITRFLTPDEVDELSAEQNLGNLIRALRRSVDTDELFYLQAMRRIIESCDEPYYTRRKAFEEIATEAEALRGGNDYPFAAARLFLKDIEAEQQEQALDRAQYEALYLALSHAAGQPSDRFKVSPASGKPYQVRRDGSRIVVEDPGYGSVPGISIAVPVKAEGEKK